MTLLGLRVAMKLLITTIEFRCDSQLVASQLGEEYEAKSERMEQYLQLAQSLMVGFEYFGVTQVPLSKIKW